MKENILGLFNLKPFIINQINDSDFIKIEPYQISCLYGADKLSVNFIYTIEQLFSKQYLTYEVIASKVGIFSYKLKFLRLLHWLIKYKKTKKNRIRIKLNHYLNTIYSGFTRINIFK